MACLNTAGRGRMQNTQDSRIKKTKLFFEDTLAFLAKLEKEIASTIKSAKKKAMTAVFRPNLTSDLMFEEIENRAMGKLSCKSFPTPNFMTILRVLVVWQSFSMGIS